MKPKPIVEPVYLRFGRHEHHIGDLEIPYSVTTEPGSGTGTVSVDTDGIPARVAALLRAAADHMDPRTGQLVDSPEQPRAWRHACDTLNEGSPEDSGCCSGCRQELDRSDLDTAPRYVLVQVRRPPDAAAS